MTCTRDEGRNRLRVYMSRSGMGLREIASRTGFAHRSLVQFVSGAKYGDGDGSLTATALADWIAANPLPEPELPGRLHETAATREMDQMLEHIGSGGWGILYGPSGAQKTFYLEYRAAETPGDMVYVRASAAGMRPGTLLRRIAAWIGAPYAQSVDSMRQSILWTIRQRRTPLALAIDESDHLYHWVETLETLREIGDLSRRKLGILIAGNERVERIFENRRSCYFEKWNARIQQMRVRVSGATDQEAAGILAAEMGALKEKAVRAILDGCRALDPISKQPYINMHRLFNSIQQIGKARGARAVQAAVQAMPPMQSMERAS